MSAQVEELPDNKVRLTVDVPSEDVHHAVEHAASDLAESVKIPGFRKGKVPMPVLLSRIGKERLYTEAIESHIAGWYGNAVARSRIRPADRPELEEELIGMRAGETKDIELPRAGDEQPAGVQTSMKEIKEKVLPPLDDELARSASEFDTLDELRTDVHDRIRAQIEAEVDEVF